MSCGGSKPDASAVDIYLTVDDAHLHLMDEVAEQLRSRGLRIHQIGKALGTITGTVNRDGLDSLRHVPGVSTLNISKKYEF